MCYNPLVNESGQVDEAQTNRLAKLVEWLRQLGKTATNYFIIDLCKGENAMSNVSVIVMFEEPSKRREEENKRAEEQRIVSKIEQLQEMEALIDEAKAEAEKLKDEIKAEMQKRNTEEMRAGKYIVRWSEVLSNRFDTTAFKKLFPEVYKNFTKQTASRRFSICG